MKFELFPLISQIYSHEILKVLSIFTILLIKKLLLFFNKIYNFIFVKKGGFLSLLYTFKYDFFS